MTLPLSDPLTIPSPLVDIPRRLWRVAGAMALVYVTCFVTSIAIIGAPTVHAGQQPIEHSFVEGDVGRILAGGYVLLLGFLALLATMVFLARAVGHSTGAGRLASHSAVAAGLVYVTVIVGSALPPGAAALWGTDNGLDLQTALAVNNIRNFAYFVVMPVMGTYAIGLGLAARSDRILTRWVGWGGIGVGLACLLAIPAAVVGIQFAMPLWLLWWLGVGISLLRHRPRQSA